MNRPRNMPVMYGGQVKYAGWWAPGEYPFVETEVRTRACYLRSNHGRGRLWHVIREGWVHWPRKVSRALFPHPHVSFRMQCGASFFMDRATMTDCLPENVMVRECCPGCFGLRRGPVRRQGVHCL